MNEPIRLHPLSPPRTVPAHIPRPDYVMSGRVPPRPLGAHIHDAASIARMRRAGSVARQVLDVVLAAVAPGVTTDELDALAHRTTIELGGYPSPLFYQGFPKSICTSVNEVVCHGIPDGRRLVGGDILNVDVTVFYDGVHGDCSETVFVGRVDDESRRLVRATFEATWAGIRTVRPGRRINEIGKAIGEVARRHRLGVVRQFAGHGIGEMFHMPPQILHYFDRRAILRMVPGMIFTIEPMLNLGDWRARVLEDGWTAVTVDGLRSAQFEHTVLVTDDGFEVLTGGPHGFFEGQ
ncbi:MAG: type I methionyl aminopeptidase [bacterium]